jgi:hypothetical protein
MLEIWDWSLNSVFFILGTVAYLEPVPSYCLDKKYVFNNNDIGPFDPKYNANLPSTFSTQAGILYIKFNEVKPFSM